MEEKEHEMFLAELAAGRREFREDQTRLLIRNSTESQENMERETKKSF